MIELSLVRDLHKIYGDLMQFTLLFDQLGFLMLIVFSEEVLFIVGAGTKFKSDKKFNRAQSSSTAYAQEFTNNLLHM